MCLMYYLASDRPLPIVERNEHLPDLGVAAIATDVEPRIRTVVSSPFIYRLASWQGCSCGFCCDNRPEVEGELSEIDDEETRTICLAALQSSYNSVHSLGLYLAEQTKHGPVLLYVARAGFEGASLKDHRTITPTYFWGTQVAALPEDSLLTIVPLVCSPAAPGGRLARS